MPFVDPSSMLRGEPLPGWSGRFFHSEHMTFAYWDIAADAQDLHEHHHPEEEVWHVIDGAVVLRVGGDEQRVGAGAAAVVPANTPHAVAVVGACRAIVADYPVRDQLPGVQGT